MSKRPHPLRTTLPVALALGTAFASAVVAREAGVPIEFLQRLHAATASERALAQEAAQNAVAEPETPVLRMPPQSPRITRPAPLPGEAPPSWLPLPVVPRGPMPTTPVRQLDTTCQPFVRVARASVVTGSFLIDAPCLSNLNLVALFGDNPIHPFKMGEYGGAEFIFGAPDAAFYPLRIFERDSGQERLVQDTPDGPILVYDSPTLARAFTDMPQ